MCTSPLPARRNGGQIEFLGRAADHRFRDGAKAPLQIPCGQCAECRLKRSREWAIRVMHEASLHDSNLFLTLTYDDKHLESPSLDYSHFQRFMKRLRKYCFERAIPSPRFFCAGEYGETNPVTKEKDGGLYRPHWHCILFGVSFDDARPLLLLQDNGLSYSPTLNRLWGYGNVVIGEVTFESASYVSRYAMKKVNGDLAKAHYTVITEDGEIIEREPEMLHMSLKPAIGRRWFERHGKQVYAFDHVVARGKPMQPPRYYDKLLPEVVRGMVAREREKAGASRRKDHTDDRNNVRDVVVRAGLKTFERD